METLVFCFNLMGQRFHPAKISLANLFYLSMLTLLSMLTQLGLNLASI